MRKKLTLTIEQSIVEKAKKYAGRRERSLSYLIENYLRAITEEERVPDQQGAPKVKSLRGAFKMPENFDYKKELYNRLSEKYL